MIFEYMEIEPGEVKTKSSNGKEWKARKYDRPNLKICWNCNYDSILEPDINLTAGGYEKYSYICPKCGMLRIDNHCLSQKCLHWPIIKYAYGNYHRQNKSWLYYCPQCGNDGSDIKIPNVSDLDSIIPSESEPDQDAGFTLPSEFFDFQPIDESYYN